MTADDQTTPAVPGAQQSRRSSRRLREIARRAVWRIAPAYGRHRTRVAEMAAALARLEADFEHVRERHAEQIQRLEDLVRELVLAAESLRRGVVRANAAAGQAPQEPGQKAEVEGRCRS
jgi:hypothetical protein